MKIKYRNEYTKVIHSLSLPILMNYLLSSIFEILDKAIVGHYSTESFAAIGIAASVIYVITSSLGIFSVAFNIVAAEAVGKKDDDLFEKTFYSAMLISFFIGLIFIIISLTCGRAFFQHAYGLNGPILVALLAYFYPSSVTVLLNMILFLFSVYFRNKQNTKISFLSTAMATVTNLFFDYVLVYGRYGFPELGVRGAAWGSIIGLLSGIMVYVIGKVVADKKMKSIRLSGVCTIKMIKLYIPLLGQDFMESTVFTMIISGIVSRLGTYDMASYSLLDSIGNILILPVYAYSSSAITLALQKKAANDKNSVNDILKTTVALSFLVITCISVILMLFPEKVMGFIISDSQTIETTKRLILYLIIAQLINIFYQIYKSYLQGTGHEKFIFVTSVVVSLLSLLWVYLLSITVGIGGIYIGLCINYLVLALMYFVKLKKDM
jgi:MATE family multidrug resistance protein